MNLISPHQYRPGQKALATPKHLMDLNMCLELFQFPGICTATSPLVGVTALESEWKTDGLAPDQLVLPLTMPQPAQGRGTEEAQEVDTSSTLLQDTSKAMASHSISLAAFLSTQYYSLPLFQPGTRPAQITAKRQWSLPL